MDQEAEVKGTTVFPKSRQGPPCADLLRAWDLSFPSWCCLYRSPADTQDTSLLGGHVSECVHFPPKAGVCLVEKVRYALSASVPSYGFSSTSHTGKVLSRFLFEDEADLGAQTAHVVSRF